MHADKFIPQPTRKCYVYQRTVRFSDTDAAGVVYFANVLSICHEAYEASLKASGINIKGFFTNLASVGFPIVHANVDFLRPMYCGDELIVSLFPTRISVDTFEIIYEVTVVDVLVAKAMTRHVCIDVNSRTRRELTDEIIAFLV